MNFFVFVNADYFDQLKKNCTRALKYTSGQQWLQLIRMSYICLIPLTFKIRRICRKKNVIKAMHFIRINEMFFFQLCMYLDVIWSINTGWNVFKCSVKSFGLYGILSRDPAHGCRRYTWIIDGRYDLETDQFYIFSKLLWHILFNSVHAGTLKVSFQLNYSDRGLFNDV